tara:strand:- start:1684 stop:2268 length:585 start_codon:yes stop_codon:yes gene_type:complete
MDKKRKAYAPFSLTSEAGVAQTPVEGYIDVNQSIYPTVNTGVVNENGKWTGVKSDDEEFIGLTKAIAIGNGANVAFPDTNNISSIDMTGFSTLQIALKSTVSGQYGVATRFGPDTTPFCNLSPIASGEQIRIVDSQGTVDESIIDDNNVNIPADVWDIVTILADRCKGQKNMQVFVTNSTGSDADIEFGFRRLV